MNECENRQPLEGVLDVPDGEGPFPGIMLCHPHPYNGGTMNNVVIRGLFDELGRHGFAVLRFNYRSVGKSLEEDDFGVSEQDDVYDALSFLASTDRVDSQRIGIAGYSAGAAYGMPIGCNDERIKALAAISPPFSMSDFSFLKSCLKPKLVVAGTQDVFATTQQLVEFCSDLPQPGKFECVKGADHFWNGYVSTVVEIVTNFFRENL